MVGGKTSDHICQCGKASTPPTTTAAPTTTAEPTTTAAPTTTPPKPLCADEKATFCKKKLAKPGTERFAEQFAKANFKSKCEQSCNLCPTTDGPPTDGNLCTTNRVKTGSVTKKVCTNTPDVCEVYIKKGDENSVSNIETCRQYCNAYGMTCTAQYEDKNGCGRDYQYVHTRARTFVFQMGVLVFVWRVWVVLAPRNTHYVGPADWA